MCSNRPLATVSTAKGGPSLSDFTNTFVFSSTSGKDEVLSEIPKALAIDPSRKRRAHQKSLAGCENCRKRRVKCNEGTPCENCSRRRECCQRPRRCSRVVLDPSIPRPLASQPLVPGFGSTTDAVVNLQHLKLFHHFQTFTRPTLILCPDVWDGALQLAFQSEFLMNTILCITARHLAFLRPEDATYPRAAASHLCRALSGFRHELANNFTSIHIDAFIATSLLLQYEAWYSDDFLSPQDDDIDAVTPFDPSRDPVFGIGSSLKEVFLKSVPLIANQPSKFLPLLRHNPVEKLVAAARISSSTLTRFQEFFSYQRPINMELLNVPLPFHRNIDLVVSDLWKNSPNTTIPIEDGYVPDGYLPAIARVCLVLSFLPEAQPPDYTHEESTLFSDLLRYILLFPVGCHGPFSTMVQQGDPHALFLLYHFYRAVRILLPPQEYWWAYKRATACEANLKEWLTKKSTK